MHRDRRRIHIKYSKNKQNHGDKNQTITNKDKEMVLN